jgi:hypothetical protein
MDGRGGYVDGPVLHVVFLSSPGRIILGSCHAGPVGGAPAAGAGGGVPAERIPRVTPPNLARRGGIANEFKKD